jgi:2-oxoglutarate dehydrogenase E2 component (dihydrolipoamide succinyltransferase)
MGESITGGVLSAWRVKEGDIVDRDQVLFELETDKITSEGMADAAGRISLKVQEGEEVAIGDVVAEIDESAAGDSETDAPTADGTKTREAEAREEATGDRLSPAVRRIAEETGIAPSSVQGSGKAGRVTKGDILAAAEQQKAAPPAPAKREERPPPAAAAAKEPSGSAEPRTTRRKLSPMRQRIAQRLVAAQQDAAILSTFNEVDLSAVRDLRAKYQDKFVERHGIKLGFMSFFIKATVYALKEIPALNAQLEGDTLVQNHFYDIGVAVSSEKGLLVPVIRGCDSLSLAGLEKELAGYAKKAREGKIQITDLEGGVFTISNGGIFGSLLSTPIINPPQSGILGMHAIQERPVAVNGQVVIRPMMYLALSYDHRLVDGREAVTFLVRIKQAIEDPTRLLLDI